MPGTDDWVELGEKADALLQGGGDGSLAFKQKLARSALAECLVCLALSVALWKESDWCVLLQTELKVEV